jgi:hypothetical protein
MDDLTTLARCIAEADALPPVETLRDLTSRSIEEREARRKKEADERRKLVDQQIEEAVDAIARQFKAEAANAARRGESSCRVEALELARFSNAEVWTLEIRLKATSRLASTLREMTYLAEVETNPLSDHKTVVLLTVSWEKA